VKVIIFFVTLLGSFGIVYKAVHKTTNEIRAVKFITKSAVSNDKVTKLIQEINILKKMVF